MEQRTDEWFSARRGRVTASMTGAILGNSPWMTREDAMRSLVRSWHGAESEFTGNVATAYGTYHEAGALMEYMMETGNAVTQVGLIIREEWAGASPDGLVGLVGGLEIKCPFKFRHAGRDDQPPAEFVPIAGQPHYHDQVQFSLWVCERAWWDFWQWAPNMTPMLERVMPCSKWRTKSLPKLKAFWDDFVIEREDPKLSARHLEPKRVQVETPEAARILAEYDELVEAIDNATDRKKELLASLVKLARDRDAEICGRNLTHVSREGSVAYAKVVKEHLPKLDLEPYRGAGSSYWVLK